MIVMTDLAEWEYLPHCFESLFCAIKIYPILDGNPRSCGVFDWCPCIDMTLECRLELSSFVRRPIRSGAWRGYDMYIEQ